jgi:hypothetical protein
MFPPKTEPATSTFPPSSTDGSPSLTPSLNPLVSPLPPGELSPSWSLEPGNGQRPAQSDQGILFCSTVQLFDGGTSSVVTADGC